MNRGLRESTSRGRVVPLGDGRNIELRPMGLRDVAQLEEQALADHKRLYLETFTKNRDLMPVDLANEWLREAFQNAAAMTVDSLPLKMQGDKPIPYAFWWAANTVSGMLHSVWLSVRKADSSIKFDDLDDALGTNLGRLEELANEVGELSSPTEGNGREPSQEAAAKMTATTTA